MMILQNNDLTFYAEEKELQKGYMYNSKNSIINYKKLMENKKAITDALLKEKDIAVDMLEGCYQTAINNSIPMIEKIWEEDEEHTEALLVDYNENIEDYLVLNGDIFSNIYNIKNLHDAELCFKDILNYSIPLKKSCEYAIFVKSTGQELELVDEVDGYELVGDFLEYNGEFTKQLDEDFTMIYGIKTFTNIQEVK